MNFMCRMCSLCCWLCRLNSQGYWFKQKQSYKLSIGDFPKLFPATLQAHPSCVSIWSTRLLLLLISKILKGLDYDNTTLVDCLFSRDDFDCSVIHTWCTAKSKAVIGWVTILQTWREHLPENGSWILIGLLRERNVVRFSAAVSGEEQTKLGMVYA